MRCGDRAYCYKRTAAMALFQRLLIVQAFMQSRFAAAQSIHAAPCTAPAAVLRSSQNGLRPLHTKLFMWFLRYEF
jgi:hypothetical protein